MSNLSLVTDNMLPVANETFVDNLSAGISAGAAIVPINSLSEYADGDSVVLTVDPGTASQATFIGEKQGNTVIDCKWTEGNVGASHAAGATVIDYDSATHYNVVTKILRMFANENGTLKSAPIQAAIGLTTTPSIGWNVMAQPMAWVSNDGYGQFGAQFTGDVTGFLKEGMKLQVPRTVAPGTQCIKLVGSSLQSATRPSANLTNINFTNTATIIAKINPGALPGDGTLAQGTRTILARRPATGNNGWGFRIGADGQLEVYWANGSAYTTINAPQCPAPEEWQTVAVSFTAATRTASFYINSMLIGTYSVGSGDTVIGQTGDLALGGIPLASNEGFFDGLIAEVSLFNTVLTGTQIAGYANQPLAGNEANIVGLWRGNGNFNDSTANANHLTANGGASPTFADNPFKATEYFYVTQVGAFAGGFTPVKLFGGTKHTLPNQALGVIQYSNVASPAGFPAERGAWRYRMIPRRGQFDYAGIYGGTPGSGAFYDLWRIKIMANVGKWKVGYEAYWISTQATNPYAAISSVLTTATHNTAIPTPIFRFPTWGGQASQKFFRTQSGGNVSIGQYDCNTQVYDVPVSVTTQTQLYLLMRSAVAGLNNLYMNNVQSNNEVYFEIAYP